MTTKAQPLGKFLLAMLGPTVWAAHFFVVYGVEAAVCTRAASPAVTMRWIVAAATTAAVAGLAAVLMLRFRGPPGEPEDLGFLRKVSVYLALLSLGAILAVAAAALAISPYVQPTG
jgi:hypothetical protein